MINTYERRETKIQAVQLFNDSEAIDDVKEFLGDKFIGFQNASDGKFFVFWKLGKDKAFAAETDYIYRTAQGFVYSMTKKEFEKTYKKIWD